MKKLTIVLALAGLLATGCNSKNSADKATSESATIAESHDGTHHVLTPADSGRTLAPQVGDTIIFTAQENPSTGYVWTADFDSSMLLETANAFTSSTADPQIVGAPGVRSIRYEVKAPGSTALVLTLSRQSETSYSEQVRFQLEVPQP